MANMCADALPSLLQNRWTEYENALYEESDSPECEESEEEPDPEASISQIDEDMAQASDTAAQKAEEGVGKDEAPDQAFSTDGIVALNRSNAVKKVGCS